MAHTFFHIALIGLESSIMDIVEAYLSNWTCTLSTYDVWPEACPQDIPWTHVLCSLDMYELLKAGKLPANTPVVLVLRREDRSKIEPSTQDSVAGMIFLPFEAQDLYMVLNQSPPGATPSPSLDDQNLAFPSDESLETPQKFIQNQYLRVDQEKIDGVLNLIGELVVTKSQLLENETVISNSDQKLSNVVSLLDKTIRELQDKSLSLRMTPLRPLFLKLQRMSRDLAPKMGKTIDFEMQGGETEIDRLLIDAISDPLLHLCRNAIDHGIEAADTRSAAGKSSRGKIKIVALQRASRIDLSISDDGAGLSKSLILSKALEKGLVKQEQIPNLSDKNIYDLIFHPGFSTSAVLNEVSGRGVGMSVVKSQIENIRGEVCIETTPGKGTTFLLKLPLTTAITEGFLVKICDNTCVVPLNRVLEFLELPPTVVKKTNQKREMIKLRDNFIPLYRLDVFFRKKESSPYEKKPIALIVDCDDEKCAILVDDVLGQSQIVAKALGKTLDTTHFAAGSAILGNGRIALILDIPGIVSSLKSNRKAGHAA